MLAWLYLGMERLGRSDPARTARLVDHVPLWFNRRLARAKLVRTLTHVWRNAPAQRERWQRAGIRRAHLRNPDVLARIPFTEPIDLAERPDDFRCVPPGELTHVFTTTGTKGKPKKVYLTADDFERQVRLIGTFHRRFPGARRALAMFNVDLPTWSAGSVAREGIEKAGMFGLLSGTASPVETQIDLIREYDIDTLLSMPAYVHRITLEARVDLRTLGVRYIQLGGQAWSENFRREIETAWGAKVIDVYGSMECVCGTAAECVMQNGLHVGELEFEVEIVDPDTGEGLPDGEEGEIVLTTLSRRGMPLVRYRTHDLAHLLPRGDRCACGLPNRRMSRVRGRLDDVIIIGGDANIYGDEWDRAVLAVPGVSDYQIVVTREGYRDVLTLRAEGDLDDPVLAQKLADAVARIPHVNIALNLTRTASLAPVEIVPRGTLSAGRAKSRRIVDERETPTAVRVASENPHP